MSGSGGWTEELFDADYARVWGFPGAEVTAAEVEVLLRPLGWYDGLSLRPFDLHAPTPLLVVAERS